MAEALRSRVLALLGTSSELFNGISNKLESALSPSEASTTAGTGDTRRITTPSSDSWSEHGAAPPGACRKLHALPSFGPTYEDRAALARHRRAREARGPAGGASPSRHSLDADGASDAGAEAAVERELVASGPDPYDKLRIMEKAPHSASSGSDVDGYGPSTSIESEPQQHWLRSGSEGSVQSWASSLSLDSQSDEAAAVDFMRAFVTRLFGDSGAITQEQKATFGHLCQETGRLWFARFVNAQRARSRRVEETTFYALVQYFATALFECAEADDFSPAKSLMNMCFTFYLEVEVPGCEPYKEYLYTFLRHQPIWHTLRFWNAAFFDALQCERAAHPAPARDDVRAAQLEAFVDDTRYQENITFGQLGTFTYNMHAFGLSRELCLEFLRKQCTIANLSTDQESMLKENITKIYRETEPWRA